MWADYSTLKNFNKNYSSLSLCLPHTRWMIEAAFNEWQQIADSESGDTQILDSNSKAYINSIYSKALNKHFAADIKQAFRPEKRYRRR